MGLARLPKDHSKANSIENNKLTVLSSSETDLEAENRKLNHQTIVTAAIIREENSVLLARRGPDEKLAGFWEFPGGKVEPGETPEKSLTRELSEELAIEVRIGDRVAESSYQYEHGTFHIIAYMVEWISGNLRPQVHDRLDWVKIDDLTSYQLLPADIPIAESLQRHRGRLDELF